MVKDGLLSGASGNQADLRLSDGDRVAVIGGGPAGSFFSYFLLQMAERLGVSLHVDIYERKSYTRPGPGGCNHCGGIVSESLVQLLATEGIRLPDTIVQRGIDSYVLHMDAGSVRIQTPSREKRIAAMYRGRGPLGDHATTWESFDAHLLDLAARKGAEVKNVHVNKVAVVDEYPLVTTRDGESSTYDLVVGAHGVNMASADLFEDVGLPCTRPGVTGTFICEYGLGAEKVQELFGDSMHVFLLDIPRLKFAALIPKGNHVTMCLLGEDIDRELVTAFQTSDEVRSVFPPGFDTTAGAPCKCFPRINIRGIDRPFADRILMLGDAAVTRLYKDGIGAAYVTAKVAATTVMLQGVSARALERHYLPVLRGIERDNRLGKAIFLATRLVQQFRFTREGILRMVRGEQGNKGPSKRMSGVLWDTFTGSASYRNILGRSLRPGFLLRLAKEMSIALLTGTRSFWRRPQHVASTAGEALSDR